MTGPKLVSAETTEDGKKRTVWEVIAAGRTLAWRKARKASRLAYGGVAVEEDGSIDLSQTVSDFASVRKDRTSNTIIDIDKISESVGPDKYRVVVESEKSMSIREKWKNTFAGGGL